MIEEYKESPLGKIPMNWKVNKLSEFTEEITDYVSAGSFASLKDNIKVFNEPNYSIYVRLTDLRKGLGHSEQKYVDKDSYEFLSKSNLYGREILFANIGANVGEVWMMPNIPTKATIAPNMIVIRANNKNVVPEYLHSYFRSPIGLRQIDKIIAGSGHPKINKTELRQLLAILPPLPEQQKIAEILSAVDEKIEIIDQQIIKAQELKKGLMQRLLTKGIGHTEFKDSPLGMIPESWEVVELDEVCNVIDPHPSHRAPKEDSNGFPFVGIGDINKNGEINLEKSRKISIEDIEKQKETFTLEENDMGFGRVASIGKVVWFKKQEFPYAISPTMALIKAKKVNPFYCYQFLSSSLVTDQFRLLSVGSTRTSIGMKSLRTLKFLLPSKTEQLQISEILLTVDKKLEVLSEKKTHYQELKQGLMQQLLTGKIRVKV